MGAPVGSKRAVYPRRAPIIRGLQRLFREIVPGVSVSSTPISPVTADGAASEQTPLELELATLLVESLNLEVAPADVEPNAPLYGEGLGLDSIDILEVALEVSRRYGFQLRSDDERNQQIFTSLRTLATHVAQNKTVD
ncbi:MAG: acyl carrier protein [Variovorax sp.]|uniref:Acyl carrier protein n=1 Tax=Variovorax guangxiensis TaxID=1775474 RepID=A0A502DZW7_9BURK|nr:MAG: acyl carrier protein [Variovorax sp.]TPG26917.1 acyl carrier protein [Variovorax ginsengisoli]TPG30644.1 acyl carrier protein [Variovorax guangxiensis]